MNSFINVGVIGCGTISHVYIENIVQNYKNLRLVAVSDYFPEKAKEVTEKYDFVKACSTEELLADPDISIVLNLTIPMAHYSINKQILNSNKHVYCEKPLALETDEAKELVEEANKRNLMCVSAPDTFLGSGIQTVRSLIDSGKIGKPTGFTANMTSSGHELWHPNPGFYYQKGGGPVWDMGPYYLTALIYLLGPIEEISCFATSGRPMRNILGKMQQTEVSTHYTAIIKLCNGATGTVTMSFDIWNSSLPLLEFYGTKGSITAPDPNYFSGPVQFFDGEKLKDIVDRVQEPHPAKVITMIENTESCLNEIDLMFPFEPTHNVNMRGLGVSDMAVALLNNRKSRLSSDLSLHVVEAMQAFDISASSGKPYKMTTTCVITDPMDKNWKLWEVK